MVQVTLSVLEGLERGRIYKALTLPVTIGREEDNTIQLNDERVSRIHAKLQEDRGRVILTDLNSTNGSRVNGHPVQLRVLQAGDHLQIGRCTLLFGSDDEISSRAARLGLTVAALNPLQHPDNVPRLSAAADSQAEFSLSSDLNAENLQLPLFPGGRPPLPNVLSAADRACLSDVLSFIHERLREVAVEAIDPDESASMPMVDVPWDRWQNLLLLQRDLAAYLREVANPGDE
ncbi:MAG: FHA domain-containing protein [Planctomycetaceae bacterium]